MTITTKFDIGETVKVIATGQIGKVQEIRVDRIVIPGFASIEYEVSISGRIHPVWFPQGNLAHRLPDPPTAPPAPPTPKFKIGDHVQVKAGSSFPFTSGPIVEISAHHDRHCASVNYRLGPNYTLVAESELEPAPAAPALPSPDAPWSREHDRVIAERVEGLGRPWQSEGGCWYVDRGPKEDAIPDYSTDLAAIVRACEAARRTNQIRCWRMGNGRGTTAYAKVTDWVPKLNGDQREYYSDGEPAEALARAAYRWTINNQTTL